MEEDTEGELQSAKLPLCYLLALCFGDSSAGLFRSIPLFLLLLFLLATSRSGSADHSVALSEPNHIHHAVRCHDIPLATLRTMQVLNFNN
jgi:hypothetical protein